MSVDMCTKLKLQRSGSKPRLLELSGHVQLSPHGQLLMLLRDALDLQGTPGLIDEAESRPVIYHITMVDGGDFEVTLSKEASIYDANVVIAA